jgi:hypothetical protein
MALVTFPTNVDYLIPDIRLRIGDLSKTTFSDTIVRTALINGIKFLQSKWHGRYQVYTDTMLVTPQPTDAPTGYIYAALYDGYHYIPSGLFTSDVFRNPSSEFTDPSTAIITQIDEYPITLAALLFLRESLLSGSQQSFVNWSDGEYSYSNVASSKIMESLGGNTLAELNAYFKARRAVVLRENFTNYIL